MRTVLRNSSRQTLRLFSRPRHASGPLLRPYSRRSLLRSQSRRSQTTVKPIFVHPRTSLGRRSSQYHIEYIFPRPSQAYALWYRSSRRIVFSTLEERRSHWLTQVRRRRLSDIEKRWRTWLSRRTARRLRPALQRNRFRRLVNQFPELFLSPHQETFCAMISSRAGISDPTSNPSAESRTTLMGSSTLSATLPSTSSTTALDFHPLQPVNWLDGPNRTPSLSSLVLSSLKRVSQSLRSTF
uniref:Uncharacterized protein n=1 Tax=Siphoviridae sp. ctTaQ5 TaxID=2827877 RepID=A0A8S5SQ78_9CAUD|nr:MAG TPA: hypothetical protein [Siphoviridae sp. ctTaQ5]